MTLRHSVSDGSVEARRSYNGRGEVEQALPAEPGGETFVDPLPQAGQSLENGQDVVGEGGRGAWACPSQPLCTARSRINPK